MTKGSTVAMWMIRAGRNAVWLEDFLERRIVAVAFAKEVGAVAPGTSRDALVSRVQAARPAWREGKCVSAAGQIYRFNEEIHVGDTVVTYDPSARRYYLGRVTSPASHHPDDETEMFYHRSVDWTHRVERSLLNSATLNTLGAILSLFRLNDDVAADLRTHATPIGTAEPVEPLPAVPSAAAEEDDQRYEEILTRSHELIEDRLAALDADDMEELVAGVLSAMGYKARVSPKGADRGVDVFASPDGLGLEAPRIFVEVKHRPGTKMGSQAVRSLLGGRQSGDRCLFVSSGGFAKDAVYEAERSSVPLTLIDLPRLRELVVEHYGRMGDETRRLVPLVQVWWPAPRDS